MANEHRDTYLSEQGVLNRSNDRDFDQLAVELLGYDGSVLRRVKTDSSGNLVVNADIDMATEGIATEATLDSIKDTDGIKKIIDPVKAEHLSGTGSDTSVTLTSANTAYAIPASAPNARYTLIVYNGSDTDVMLGFTNTTTLGWKIISGEKFVIDLDASDVLYAWCASAGKVLNISYKEVV